MRQQALLSLALAVAASVFAGAAAGGAKPTVRVVRDLPLTIQGAHFRPRESVRITVVMGERRLSKGARAGTAGGFTVRFASVHLDRCAVPLVITARGGSSGLVRAKLPIRDCAMP